MNISLLVNKARKDLETARTKAAQDEKTARIARETARAAKLKLKHARKLSKLAKKSARKADDQAEVSAENLDRIQAKLEKLEKRAKKQLAEKSAVSRSRTKTKPASSSSLQSKISPIPLKRTPVRKEKGIQQTAEETPVASNTATPESSGETQPQAENISDASASA